MQEIQVPTGQRPSGTRVSGEKPSRQVLPNWRKRPEVVVSGPLLGILPALMLMVIKG